MTVTIEKINSNEVKLNIEIESAVASWEYDKACKKLAKRVNVPGFRRGKAPKNILEKYVGVAALRREVLDSILPSIFESAVDENKFDLLSAPSIESFEFADDKSLKVVAKLTLKPEVKPENYKGMEIEIEKFKNPDDIMDRELQTLAEKFSTLKDVTDRESQNTDLVNIDFNGYVDGEEIKGGSAKSYVLDLAHSNFIPGFAEQLEGKKAGEEFKINVQFPDEYHDEKLKGKDAEFNIKLNSIQERILPEMNDELAKKINEKFSSMDDVKQDIQKFLDNNEKAENERRAAVKIFDMLVNNTDIELPDTMINGEIQALMGEFKQRINMQGGNYDEMLEKEGHEKVYAQMKEEAVKRIKTSLIVAKIAQIENISVTQEDIQNKIADMVNIYKTAPENIIAEIRKNSNILRAINQEVITRKVTKLLLDSAKISYKN